MNAESNALPADPEAQRAARIAELFEMDWKPEATRAIGRHPFRQPPMADQVVMAARTLIASRAGVVPLPYEIADALAEVVDQLYRVEADERLAEYGLPPGSSPNTGAATATGHRKFENDIVRPPGAPPTDLLSLAEGLVASARLIRTCTPSVLLRQRVADDVLMTDTSVSFEQVGSPIAGDGVFAGINRLIQEFYGVDHAWPLVNGSSGANWTIARLLRLRLVDDEVVLVSRGSHVSVPQSLTDFGISWRYIEVEPLPLYEAVLPPTADDVRRALEGARNRSEQVGAVWVNGPSYEGVMVDTGAIREVIDSDAANALLVVDEAWGSHLPASRFGDRIAAVSGADIANSSTHKAAGGLQGTAVLVMGRESRLSPMEVDASVKALYSTSPSFHLLASIEAVYAELNASKWLVPNLEMMGDDLRRMLRERAPQVQVFGDMAPIDRLVIDPLKVTMSLAGCVEQGYDLAHTLAAEGVIVEMATTNTVTFLMTHQLRRADLACIAELVATLTTASSTVRQPPKSAFDVDDSIAADPSAAARRAVREGEVIDIDLAANRIAGERVAVYPPGIPLFVEGQRITREQIDVIVTAQSSGAHFAASGGGRGRHTQIGHSVIVLPHDDGSPG